ncbi:MAG: B12-binding domain-containing radical SAM protein [Elusimicrobia bacterium]|nr:B12-binding domain-containing radical SAM protein [Elusimicrobiota bacterium]
MARIVLVRPPSVFSASSYSAPVTMPLSAAYLAAVLLEAGHKVEVLDALGDGVDHVGRSYLADVEFRGLTNEQIVERIADDADAIGLSAMFSQDWPHIETIINAIHKKLPNVPIMVGGEHPTAASEYTLRSCPAVSYTALGEGEQTMVEFADFLDGKRKIEDVSGIEYLKDGQLVSNPPRARIRAVDDIPWPAWHLFNLEPYFETGEGHGVERGRSMPILATRGCPYQCTFCSNPGMWTTRYVMRDVEDVVDEIQHYLTRYQATNIDFYDLTAIVKKDWTMKFCNEIKKRKLKFTWQLPSGTRSEALDDEALKAMAETGCMNMTYAPESGSERTLELIKKKVKLPRLISSIRSALKYGIFVKCNLIIGFPKDERIDVYKTLWLAMKFAIIGCDDTGVYVFSPYPGSELYDYLRSTGAIRDMDREYFESLMSFMNLKAKKSYCENIGPNELGFYRVVGMGLFYGLSYLLHPSRIFRSIRNYREDRSDTVFEERLFGFLHRRALARQTAKQAKTAAEAAAK